MSSSLSPLQAEYWADSCISMRDPHANTGKYIDVKGKISDGLTVEVKAGANTWYVKVG